MGKLWVDRIIDIAGGEISDDADGPNVVVAHAAVEQAMSEIFGIPMGLNITKGIFENPSNFAGVTSAGKISMMRFKARGIPTDAADSCGLEFYDGVNRRRLTIVDSELQVWGETSDVGVWEMIYNHETEVEGTLSGKVDAGPSVRDKSVPEYVMAVETDGETAYFTLVEDVVFETGRTRFIELADVHAGFRAPSWGDTPYDEAKAGWGVAIDGDSTYLIPRKLAEINDTELSFHMWTSFPWSLGVVGPEGGGGQEWTTLGQYQIAMYNYTAETIPDLVTLSGVPNAAVELGMGVYKVQPSFRATSADGGAGKIMFRYNGYGFHQHPQENLRSQEIPWKYVEPIIDDWWLSWEPETNLAQPYIAMTEIGTSIMVVPSSAVLGIEMGRTNGDVSVMAQLAIERIQ